MQMPCHRRVLICLVAFSLAGCAVATPYVPHGGPATISRGQSVPPADLLGNVFGLLSKIVLWNWKVANHSISPATEAHLARYLATPHSMTEGTHFSLNEYAPGRALKRLVKNRKVAWPYRLVIGLPVTLITDVLLPGRLFAGLIGGDSYNPYTDTVAIYSDLPSIALHEAGHSHDFNMRRYKGTYAFVRLVPFVDLYQEFQATDETLRHLVETGEQDEEIAAYKILYPAYGTYVGAYLLFPGASLAGALIGHIWGRTKAHDRRKYYESIGESVGVPAP